MIPVVVLSLARSPDRRAAIGAHLDALAIPFRFFDAIDGASLSEAELRAAAPRLNPRRYGAPLLPAEIAVGLGFARICAAIAAGPDEFALVIEDDITVDPAILALLDPAILRALPAFDVLRLQHLASPWLPVATYGDFAIRAPLRATHGLYAQIFSREGARKAAAVLASPWMPADMLLFGDGHARALRVLEVAPTLAFHPAAERDRTTIDPDRVRALAASKASAPARLRRALYELASRLRVLRNFVALWGPLAVLRLRR